MANKSLQVTCISALLRLEGSGLPVERDSPRHRSALKTGPLKRIKEVGTLSPAELLSRSGNSERRGTLWWVSLLTGTWTTDSFNIRVKDTDASLPGAWYEAPFGAVCRDHERSSAGCPWSDWTKPWCVSVIKKHEQVSRIYSREVFQQACIPDKMLVRETVDDFRVAVCLHRSLVELEWVNIPASFSGRWMLVPSVQHFGWRMSDSRCMTRCASLCKLCISYRSEGTTARTYPWRYTLQCRMRKIVTVVNCAVPHFYTPRVTARGLHRPGVIAASSWCTRRSCQSTCRCVTSPGRHPSG